MKKEEPKLVYDAVISGTFNCSFPSMFDIGGVMFEDNKMYQIKIFECPEPEFDWDDIKVGMAFECTVGTGIVWYVGEDISNDKYAIYTEVTKGILSKHLLVLKKELTRSPEHDEVK